MADEHNTQQSNGRHILSVSPNSASHSDSSTVKHSWAFERVLRECQHNDELQRKGVSRGLLYDFRVLRDGQHVAWWCQYGANGQTDTRGFRYWLRDKLRVTVSNGNHYPAEHPIAARNREDFESILEANAHLIPTDEELAERKREADLKEEARKAHTEAREKIRRMEAAAPQLLEALKFAQEILKDQAERFHKDCRCQLCESCLQTIEAAISKAERGQ